MVKPAQSPSEISKSDLARCEAILELSEELIVIGGRKLRAPAT